MNSPNPVLDGHSAARQGWGAPLGEVIGEGARAVGEYMRSCAPQLPNIFSAPAGETRNFGNRVIHGMPHRDLLNLKRLLLKFLEDVDPSQEDAESLRKIASNLLRIRRPGQDGFCPTLEELVTGLKDENGNARPVTATEKRWFKILAGLEIADDPLNLDEDDIDLRPLFPRGDGAPVDMLAGFEEESGPVDNLQTEEFSDDGSDAGEVEEEFFDCDNYIENVRAIPLDRLILLVNRIISDQTGLAPNAVKEAHPNLSRAVRDLEVLLQAMRTHLVQSQRPLLSRRVPSEALQQRRAQQEQRFQENILDLVEESLGSLFEVLQNSNAIFGPTISLADKTKLEAAIRRLIAMTGPAPVGEDEEEEERVEEDASNEGNNIRVLEEAEWVLKLFFNEQAGPVARITNMAEVTGRSNVGDLNRSIQQTTDERLAEFTERTNRITETAAANFEQAAGNVVNNAAGQINAVIYNAVPNLIGGAFGNPIQGVPPVVAGPVGVAVAQAEVPQAMIQEGMAQEVPPRGIPAPGAGQQAPLAGGLLAMMTPYFNGALANLGGFASRMAAQSLVWVLEKAEENAQGDNNVRIVQELKERAQGVANGEVPWLDFYRYVSHALNQDGHPLRITLGNIVLPGQGAAGGGRGPGALDTFNAILRRHPQEEPGQPENIRAKIEREKVQFIRNTEAMIAISAANKVGHYLGLPELDHASISAILQDSAANPGSWNFAERVRRNFFGRLNTQGVSFYKQWTMQAAYQIAAFLGHLFTAKMTHKIVDNLLQQIKLPPSRKNSSGDLPLDNMEHDPERVAALQMKFRPLENTLIVQADRYCEAVNMAYREIKQQDDIRSGERVSDIVARKLDEPSRNRVHGQPHTKKQLYKKATDRAIDEYFPSVFDFGKEFTQWLDQTEIPHVAKLVLRSVIGAVLGLVDKSVDTAFKSGAKMVATQFNVVDTLIEGVRQSVETDRNARYTHVINQVLDTQLLRIIEILNQQGGEALAEEGSPEIRRNLVPLIENVMQILNARKHHTVSGVIESEGSLRDWLEREVEGMATDQVVDVIVRLIATGYKSLVQPEQLEGQVFNMLHLLNQTFTAENDPTPEQVEEVSLSVRAHLHQIISLSINKAVDEWVDHNQKAQEAEQAFVQEMQAQTRNFVGTMRDLIGEENPDAQDLLLAFTTQRRNEHSADVQSKVRLFNENERRLLDQRYSMPLATKVDELDQLINEECRQGPEAQLELIGNKLAEIEEFAEGIRAVGRIDIQFGVPDGLINLGKGFLKQKLVEAVKQKAEEAIKFVTYEPYNFKNGLHHLLLIPYVEGRLTLPEVPVTA